MAKIQDKLYNRIIEGELLSISDEEKSKLNLCSTYVPYSEAELEALVGKVKVGDTINFYGSPYIVNSVGTTTYECMCIMPDEYRIYTMDVSKNSVLNDEYTFASASSLPSSFLVGHGTLTFSTETVDDFYYFKFVANEGMRNKIEGAQMLIVTLTGGSAFLLNSPLLFTGNGIRGVGCFIDKDGNGKTTRVSVIWGAVQGSNQGLIVQLGNEYVPLGQSQTNVEGYVYAIRGILSED